MSDIGPAALYLIPNNRGAAPIIEYFIRAPGPNKEVLLAPVIGAAGPYKDKFYRAHGPIKDYVKS